MRSRIITVTMNPAIDQTIVLDNLRPGHVNRATATAFNAGGKGINVASCLADWDAGRITVAGVIGAANVGIFERVCADKRLADAMVRVPGHTRTNIKILAGGETTDINLPGLAVDEASLAAARDKILGLAGPDAILLLAGSLPPGVPAGFYAGLVAELKPSGAKIFLDTSGVPLTAALKGDALPHCIKPNRAELEDFCGHALPTVNDLIAAACSLRVRGIELVVISMAADGALFVGEKILHAAAPAIRVENSVGAGDAMVAGLIAAMAAEADLESTARLATAFAVGKLGQAGPNLPARDIIEAVSAQIQINELEGSRK